METWDLVKGDQFEVKNGQKQMISHRYMSLLMIACPQYADVMGVKAESLSD